MEGHQLERGSQDSSTPGRRSDGLDRIDPSQGVAAGQEVADREDRVAKPRGHEVEELASASPHLLDASGDALKEQNGAIVPNQFRRPAQGQELRPFHVQLDEGDGSILTSEMIERLTINRELDA